MSREEAIEILSDMRAEYNLFGDEEEATRYHVLSWAIQVMKADPVVRCKDCRWWERDYQPRYHPDERPCNRVGMGTPPDWYCADGEVRGEEG